MIVELGRIIRENKRALTLAAGLTVGGLSGGMAAAQSPSPESSPQPGETVLLPSPEGSLEPAPKTPALRVPLAYWDQHTAFESFKEHVDAFQSKGSHVELFSYYLGDDGNIKHYGPADEDEEIINFAHDTTDHKYVPVLALISNLPEDGDWDTKRVIKIISDPERRAVHIQDLLALTQEIGVDGINIDYEALPPNQRENFTVFIQELSEVMHANDKKVGVSLHIKYGDDDPDNSQGAGAQDFAALGMYADYLGVMSFERHSDGTNPGPVRSCDTYEALAEYAISKIPAKNIFMGNPIYGFDWVAGTTEAEELEHGEVKRILDERGITPEFVPEDCGSTFEYTVNSAPKKRRNHVVWYEDAATVGARLEISNELGTNAMLWRVGNEALEDDIRDKSGRLLPGGEDPAIWDLFVAPASSE